jgi:hypothetical protein
LIEVKNEASKMGIWHLPCPLWVISGHSAKEMRCPLYPQKQTLVEHVRISALCHKRTHASQQFQRCWA